MTFNLWHVYCLWEALIFSPSFVHFFVLGSSLSLWAEATKDPLRLQQLWLLDSPPSWGPGLSPIRWFRFPLWHLRDIFSITVLYIIEESCRASWGLLSFLSTKCQLCLWAIPSLPYLSNVSPWRGKKLREKRLVLGHPGCTSLVLISVPKLWTPGAWKHPAPFQMQKLQVESRYSQYVH